MTGISNDMVKNAPKFYEVAREIIELTNNTVFVAHNVGFDYNFIKNEYKNLGYEYNRETLCTIKLSRKLIPYRRSYSLGNLCNDLGIRVYNRHRAAGDAIATVELFELLLSLNKKNDCPITEITGISFRDLNPLLQKSTIHELPEEPGIYYLIDEQKNILYIGKSKNIKKRVKTHLSHNKTKRGMELKSKVADVCFELAGNELIALLMESNEIKKHKPLYNRAQRRSLHRYGIYSFYDKDGYINLKIEKNIQKDQVPLISFSSSTEAKNYLYHQIEKYQLCQKLCGLYKTAGSCFFHEINQCKGACVQKESPGKYNIRAGKFIQSLKFEENNMLIIDKGRNTEEKSVVKINNGKYIGFGFFDADTVGNNLDILDDCIKHYPDNRDIQFIIRTYLKKNKVEKLIRF